MITSATTLPTSRSDGMKPGTSALVESDSSRSTPSSPSREKPGRSVSRPSSGRLVHLEVAGVQHGLPAGADRDRQRVRDGVVDRVELAGPRRRRSIRSPSTTCAGRALIRCWSSLAATSARVSREPIDGMSRPLAQQVGQRADVVLVAVGEHDRVDVVQPVGVGRPVGQREVDAGGVGLAEQHPAVDDQQPAAAAVAASTRTWSCCGRSR